jgi:hypothetical protein
VKIGNVGRDTSLFSIRIQESFLPVQPFRKGVHEQMGKEGKGGGLTVPNMLTKLSERQYITSNQRHIIPAAHADSKFSPQQPSPDQ